MTSIVASCRGGATAIPIESGFPRSCCNRPAWLRFWITMRDSCSAFRLCRCCRPQERILFSPPGVGWVITIALGECIRLRRQLQANAVEFSRGRRRNGSICRGLAVTPLRPSRALPSMKRLRLSMEMWSACCNGCSEIRQEGKRRGSGLKKCSITSVPAISIKQ